MGTSQLAKSSFGFPCAIIRRVFASRNTESSAIVKILCSSCVTTTNVVPMLSRSSRISSSRRRELIVPSASGVTPSVLSGLTLRGGNPGVGGIDTRTWGEFPVRLRECVVEQCGSVARHAAAGDFRLISSTVRDNDGTGEPLVALLQMESLTRLTAEDCVFQDNRGRLIYVDTIPSYNTTTLTGCSFLRNEEGEVLHAEEQSVTIGDCRFEDNVVSAADVAVIWIWNSTTQIWSNLFLRNSSPYYVIGARNGPHQVFRNTFYGNHGGEALFFIRNSFSVSANVFAETTGGPTLLGYFEVSNGCNLFWNSAMEEDYIRPTDMFVDPEFCDPRNGDFRVSASSPCLGENNLSTCGDVGKHDGEPGCAGTGVLYHVVDSSPRGTVYVDGEASLAPALVPWIPGSIHTIGVDEVRPGNSSRRTVFESWDDGGEATHDVVAPAERTTYLATFSPEYRLSMTAGENGSVTPQSGWYAPGVPIEIEAIPDHGYAFVEWGGSGPGRYVGSTNPVVISLAGPVSQTANFGPGTFDLTTSVSGGEGRVVPESGAFEAFGEVTLRARAEKGWRFVEWKGQGEGSYTGRQNPVTITMDEDIEQTAHFEPVRFDLGLSLSRFSANVHEGGPVGFGEVYLWLTCASGRRVQEVEVRVQGTMDVLAFVPAPGMIAQGTNPVTVNTGFCRWAATRLGYFIVNDPGGGTLCLDTAGDDVSLQVTDCSGSAIPWPQQVSFIGIDTTGGDACSTGTGCNNQIEVGPEAGDGTIVLASPMRIGLNEVFPNPFTGETTVRYAVSRPQQVRIAVYDVTGRRVRLLWDAPVEPGVSSMVWDGRDSAGARVASGVYFVRLRSDEVTEARKVVRIGGGR